MRPEDAEAGALWDLVEAVRRLVRLTSTEAFARLKEDEYFSLAVEKLIQNVGEMARRMPEAFRRRHDDIPWGDIIGQRNIIAHNYDALLPELLWKSATVRAPKLLDRLLPLLDAEPPTDSET